VTVPGLDYSQRALGFAMQFARDAAKELKTIEELPGKKIENIKGALSYIADLIGNYAEAVNEMTKVNVADMTKLVDMFKNIKTMKENITAMGDVAALPKAVAAIGESTSHIPAIVRDINTMKNFSSLDPSVVFTFMEDFAWSGWNFYANGGYSAFQSSLMMLDDMALTMQNFKGAYAEGLATFLHEAVEDIRELDKILSKLEMDPIDVTIDKLAQKLIIDNKDIQIEHKPINITLNMNVTFKAEEFVKDIFKVANNQAKNGKTDVVAFLQNPSDPKYDPKR
jgi:hypothetical protein